MFDISASFFENKKKILHAELTGKRKKICFKLKYNEMFVGRRAFLLTRCASDFVNSLEHPVLRKNESL